jgi:5-formyltetrahydrofolate cyclo-ligase
VKESPKKELRTRIRALLEAQSPTERELASAEICSKFLEISQHDGFLKSIRRVGLFRPVHFEVQLTNLEASPALSSKKFFYPRIISKEEFEWVHVPTSAGSEAWAIGNLGIEEPAGSEAEVADPSSLDLIVVPALAYSYSAHRLGRGAGYFDRMLRKAPDTLKLGVCFDFQVIENTSSDEWDVPVDWILTETQEIRTNRMESWLAGLGRK